ncbi:MAG: glycoside hydrolase family 5 protein [Clostridiales bacterium]|nr:glycoside hydrolase family 5 protein [Clostridiales bacterium]
MKFKKILSLFLVAIMMTTILTACGKKDDKNTAGEMRNISTMELTRDMGVGINLGNTLESSGSWIDNSSVTSYETAWGSPEITEDMIKGYASAGFGVLRVPVAWSNMMEEDYTIDKDYISRVKEISDWALDSGMYVIVNIHWDGGWWEEFPTDKDECMKKYTRIWEQLTVAFKDYSDYMMFESLNEEGGWESVWNRYSGSTDGKSESFGLLNEINQKFVDIVRASGGNNEKRHLLIAGYTTDVELTCDELFVMPNDPQNRCAVSVHYYTPSTFCILEKDADWGKARYDWGTEEDLKELEKNMNMLKETFIDKDIPVILGEFGCPTKNKDPDSINLFLTSVCHEAYTREICPVLWDITDVFYDRTECKMIDPKLEQSFKEIAESK